MPRVECKYITVGDRNVTITFDSTAGLERCAGATWLLPDGDVKVQIGWRSADVATIVHEGVHVAQFLRQYCERKHMEQALVPKSANAYVWRFGIAGARWEIEALAIEGYVDECYHALVRHGVPLEVLTPRAKIRFDSEENDSDESK